MARRRIIASTIGHDPSFAFVGSSPVPGDTGGLGLLLPPDPNANPQWRYLCKLCAMQLGHAECGVIRGVRQYLTIGQEYDPGGGAPIYIVERPVQTPHWHFMDGNVSWHVMTRGIQRNRQVTPPPAAVRASNWSPDDRILQPTILYRTLPVSVDPASDTYRPLYGGRPPGTPIAGLGMIHEVRYPWDSPFDSDRLGTRIVNGPCAIEFWASVRQTDSRDRELPVLPQTSGLVPEDLFLQSYRDARYWRIAGELIVDVQSTRERCFR